MTDHPSLDELPPKPVGHRLHPGREIMHIQRIYDGDLVRGHTSTGYVRTASTLYHATICGRVKGGAMRASDWNGTEEGAREIHAERLARDANGHPADLTAKIDTNRWRLCPTCFSVYQSEEMT